MSSAKPIWLVTLLGFGVFFGVSGCKKRNTEESKSYPIIDLRGDEEHIGELDAVAYPFPTDIFTKPCATSTLNQDKVKLLISVTAFSNSPLSDRNAKQEKRLVDGTFKVESGNAIFPLLGEGKLKVGGRYSGKRSLGTFESFGEGAAVARQTIGNLNFELTQHEAPDKGIRLCGNTLTEDNVYDASDTSIRQHAALSVAGLVANASQNFLMKLQEPAYKPLLEGSDNFAKVGLSALTETYVDYDFIAPGANGAPAKYIDRQVFSENVEFRMAMTYRRDSSGGQLGIDRSFAVFPHSELYVKRKGEQGAFWNSPLVMGHEFGHFLFNETVLRKVSYSGTSASRSFSLRDVVSFVPALLDTQESNKTFIIVNHIIDPVEVGKAADPVPKAKTVELPKIKFPRGRGALEGGESFGALAQTLTDDQKREITRRVEFMWRAIDEGLADMASGAIEGTFSGFKVGCVGPDRNPEVGSFGEGRTQTPTLKRLPTTLRLLNPLEDNYSWLIQADASDASAVLANTSDCSKAPVTLRSPYTMASIFTNWLDESLKQSTGKHFAELSKNERTEFVLDAYKALKPKWSPWMSLVRNGYVEGRFDNYFGLSDAMSLQRAALEISLASSVSALLESLFQPANSESWIARHAKGFEGVQSVASTYSIACKHAFERGLVYEENCK